MSGIPTATPLTNLLPTSGSPYAMPTSPNPLTSLVLSQSLSQIDSIVQAISRSVYELADFDTANSGSSGSPATKGTKSSAEALIGSYGNLLAQVQQYKAVAPTLDPGALNTQLASFRTALSKLDERKTTLIGGGNGFVLTMRSALHYWAINVLYYVGPIFAAILITNTFYYNANAKVPNSIFWIYKLFYAFWAAVWYPAVLLYGVIDPPVFRGILPFFGTSDPTASPMPLFGFRVPTGRDDPVNAEKGKLLLRLISMLLFAVFLYAYVFYAGITPPGVAA